MSKQSGRGLFYISRAWRWVSWKGISAKNYGSPGSEAKRNTGLCVVEVAGGDERSLCRLPRLESTGKFKGKSVVATKNPARKRTQAKCGICGTEKGPHCIDSSVIALPLVYPCTNLHQKLDQKVKCVQMVNLKESHFVFASGSSFCSKKVSRVLVRRYVTVARGS